MSRFAIYDEIAPLVSDAISRRDIATKIDYDIESLESLFTIVFQHDSAINLVFFGEAKYNHITDEQLTDTVRRYITEHDMNDNLDVNLLRVTVGDDNLAFILNSHVLTPFLLGKDLRMDLNAALQQPLPVDLAAIGLGVQDNITDLTQTKTTSHKMLQRM